MKKIFFKSLLIIALLIVTFVLPVVYSAGIAVCFRLALLFFIVLESFKLFKIIIIDAKINHALSNFTYNFIFIFYYFHDPGNCLHVCFTNAFL